MAQRNAAIKFANLNGVFSPPDSEVPSTNGFGSNNPVFNADRPVAGGFNALSRLVFIVGINPISSGTNCTPPCDQSLVTSVKINEFLAFYTQFVLFDSANPAGGYTVGGYYVLSTGSRGTTGLGARPPTVRGSSASRNEPRRWSARQRKPPRYRLATESAQLYGYPQRPRQVSGCVMATVVWAVSGEGPHWIVRQRATLSAG